MLSFLISNFLSCFANRYETENGLLFWCNYANHEAKNIFFSDKIAANQLLMEFSGSM